VYVCFHPNIGDQVGITSAIISKYYKYGDEVCIDNIKARLQRWLVNVESDCNSRM